MTVDRTKGPRSRRGQGGEGPPISLLDFLYRVISKAGESTQVLMRYSVFFVILLGLPLVALCVLASILVGSATWVSVVTALVSSGAVGTGVVISRRSGGDGGDQNDQGDE
ncbi:MAG: hypothetical protein WAL50_01970 [Kineosporiaceae bacterium]